MNLKHNIMEVEKMSIKELKEQINAIVNKKGRTSNEEIDMIIKLRSELKYRYYGK